MDKTRIFTSAMWLVAMMLFMYFNKPSVGIGDQPIQVLTIDGPIAINHQHESDFDRWVAALTSLSKQPPKALIVRLNTPGGTPGATQELRRSLQQLQAQGVAIVALLEDQVFSGGVHIAVAADRIAANPATLTGSIGVIMGGFDVAELIDALPVNINIIKSGQHKDLLSPHRTMQDEERDFLQAAVMDVHDQFVNDVAEGRSLSTEAVERFADGRVFSGRKAHALGLVDNLDGFQGAVAAAQELANISDDELAIGYVGKRPPSLFGPITGELSSMINAVSFNLLFGNTPILLARF